jgi:Dual specificity phosphatase, catalytic domain
MRSRRILIRVSWSVPGGFYVFSIVLNRTPFFFIQVHCFMGISRSATIVCAYLIATMKMTADEALAAVREKRGIVSPNMGFLRQLEEYAIRLHGGEARSPLRSGRTWQRSFAGDTTPKDPNPRPASTAGVSPSSALPSSISSR